MRKKEIDIPTAGGMSLLLLVVAFQLPGYLPRLLKPDCHTCREKIFVEISGDIQWPGVYGFYQSPGLADLFVRAGGFAQNPEKDLASSRLHYDSGTNIYIKYDFQSPKIIECEMSAFYKIALGIPISLNRESPEGLAALPGIGLKTAKAIVKERKKMHGFQNVEGLLAVRGIGPMLLKKIRPYLVL